MVVSEYWEDGRHIDAMYYARACRIMADILCCQLGVESSADYSRGEFARELVEIFSIGRPAFSGTP